MPSKAGGQILDLFVQGDVGRAEFSQLGLVREVAIGIQYPGAIVLNIERKLFLRNLFLRIQSQFECHFWHSALTI